MKTNETLTTAKNLLGAVITVLALFTLMFIDVYYLTSFIKVAIVIGIVLGIVLLLPSMIETTVKIEVKKDEPVKDNRDHSLFNTMKEVHEKNIKEHESIIKDIDDAIENIHGVDIYKLLDSLKVYHYQIIGNNQEMLIALDKRKMKGREGLTDEGKDIADKREPAYVVNPRTGNKYFLLRDGASSYTTEEWKNMTNSEKSAIIATDKACGC